MTRRAAVLLAFLLPLSAHVGSPDIFFEGDAGPYHLLVTIRPPQVIPGVAEVEIRSTSPGLTQLRIVPLRLTRARQFAPAPDIANPSPGDPQFFTGSLWLMATGSWQVRITADGDRGPGVLSVPVPALATRVLGMDKAMAVLLAALGLLLCAGIVSIAGASVREAPLAPGEKPDLPRRRRSLIVMGAVTLILMGVLYFANQWWGAEDGAYRLRVFKPLQLKASLASDAKLLLKLEDPGWLNRRSDDLLPDHGHLMHLYVIRLPEMDRVMHLHPERGDADGFVQQLPDIPAGRYSLYGDIVHVNGLAETAVGQIDIPVVTGQPLTGDDAQAGAPPLSKADYNRIVSALSGGGRMLWDRGSAPLRARQPALFRFRVEDSAGQPVQDMQLYMGMLGHAAFVSRDGSVFAHVHPSGSVAMPALQLTQPDNPHAGHNTMNMNSQALPPTVSFPYGFPKPGTYRIFVQVKHGGKIETGVFDTQVEN
jgi:hypothetical protein